MTTCLVAERPQGRGRLGGPEEHCSGLLRARAKGPHTPHEMSEENLAVVQQFADRVNEQDIPGFLALVDPEVELRTLGGVQRGLEGARRFAEGGGPQEHYLTHFVHERAFDAGDQVVVFTNIQRRWRETGELGDETRIGAVFTLRAGKVLRLQAFRDRQQALEAAGLTQEGQESSP
jgi:ketosteroid isomerase-like protein